LLLLKERQKIWASEPYLTSILAALSSFRAQSHVGTFLGFRCAPPQANGDEKQIIVMKISMSRQSNLLRGSKIRAA
jgi:hypothetical protein